MAFTNPDFFALRRNIHSMYTQHAAFEQCTLTHDDLKELFVNPQDYAAVEAAARLYGVDKLNSRAEFTELTPHRLADAAVTYRVTMRGIRRWALPTYANHILPSANEALKEKLFDTALNKLQLSIEYGLVEKTLETLNTVCATPGQVAFFWPSIFIIANQPWARNDFSSKLHADLQKKPKTIPGVSPGLRQACQETALTLAAYQMLGTPPAITEEVSLNWSQVPVTTPLGTIRVSG